MVIANDEYNVQDYNIIAATANVRPCGSPTPSTVTNMAVTALLDARSKDTCARLHDRLSRETCS